MVSDQTPDDGGEPFSQFLDDYFAECDEHLIQVRRNLLLIEQQIGSASIDQGLLAELFRSFHTIKGISAMVGLSSAEQVAHHVESFLRILRRDVSAIQGTDIDLLLDGTKTLELVIDAFRRKAETPDIDATVNAFKAASQQATGTAGTAGSTGDLAPADPVTDDRQASSQLIGDKIGFRTWRFVFVSTPDLAKRGLNVSAIRARLLEIGEVLRGVPRVRENGGIAFEFDVSSDVDPLLFEKWTDDNLTWTLLEADRPIATIASSDEIGPASGGESDIQGTSQGTVSVLAPSNFVRVDLVRLDELMRLVGDLVTSRARLEEGLKPLRQLIPAPDWRSLQETSRTIGQQVRNLREGIMRVRMVQIGETFERMKFVVRDLARESGRKIELALKGQETEIDKLLVEKMMDPLLHLVRNAISHGIEPVEERIAAGKPPDGKITLSAETDGEYVLIRIADDGRGIDESSVVERAIARGLIPAGTVVDNALLLDLICAPGFSTRDVADRGSGRGVGMDVAKSVVESLGGSLELASVTGKGAEFTIRMPLTLAIADVLIANVSDHRFAVPLSAVREVIEIENTTIRVLENNEIVPYRDGVLSLVRVGRLFGLNEEAGDKIHAMVVGNGIDAIALGFDRIRGQRQIVVRGLSDPLVQVAGVGGATELGDEQVVLVLKVADLIELSRGPRPERETRGLKSGR